MFNIIKMLVIIFIFVGICLWCILGSKRTLRKHVLAKGMKMPEHIKEELKTKETNNMSNAKTIIPNIYENFGLLKNAVKRL